MKFRSSAYKLAFAPIRLLGSLPLSFHYRMAKFITWILRDVLHYRRDVVMINIARSFPQMCYTDMIATADRFYDHLGQIFAEAVWMAGCRNPQRFAKAALVEIEDAGPINELYEKCADVVILDSHTGNWELTGGIASFWSRGEGLSFPERKFCVIYKALSSALWDDVFKAMRLSPITDQSHVDDLVESGVALRYILEHRGEHKLYDFKTDQFPYGSSAKVDVGDFLNQPTTTMAGGATLAHKYGMGVAYMYMGHPERGHYTLKFAKICEDASRMEVVDIMKEFYRMLEEDLKAQPYNYLWTHRRWKQD